MTLESTMKALEEAGTAQNRKIWARHGVHDPMFGVSFATLGVLKKKAGTDHALAHGLWSTGNYDARIFATMVADPARATAEEVEAWARDVDCYSLADLLSAYVAKTAVAARKRGEWTRSSEEYLGQTGWNLMARAAMSGELDEEARDATLRRIEAEIHAAPNRVKHAMNGALIAIGGAGGKWEKAALAVAKRIGKVVVDHGDTDCKTPDATTYIAKMTARAAKKKRA